MKTPFPTALHDLVSHTEATNSHRDFGSEVDHDLKNAVQKDGAKIFGRPYISFDFDNVERLGVMYLRVRSKIGRAM
jgi:hypothetical protein